MRIGSIFWITFGFFLLLALFSMGKGVLALQKSSWEKEVEQIDRQIEDLTDRKKGLESQALRHENQAQRLQFRQGELSTARKHWKIADQKRAKAAKIQKKIDKLEEKKKQIIRNHRLA